MKRQILLLLFAAASSSLPVCAQTIATGVVADEQGQPMPGANVRESGTQNGVTTDSGGHFELRLDEPGEVVISFVGYRQLTVDVPNADQRNDLGTLSLQPAFKELKDVVITQSVSVRRKTPVATSTISAQHIEDKIGAQSLTETLKATHGVHANKQGGGHGDSEIFLRGFDNTNIAVTVNGVPMNDMEHGNVYWSNWDGLADVANTVQTQRGLGASKVSSPSVGGTINIVTHGTETEQRGVVSYSVGNDGMNKVLVTISSGLSENGWAFTLLGAKEWGDGYVQGTAYESINWFLNLSKRFNEAHQLSLTAFGAPQWHGMRSASNGVLTNAGWRQAKTQYGVKDHRYNPSFGYDKNGDVYYGEYNKYHKPQISLNHQWQTDQNSILSSSVYVSIGRGYGHSGEANSKIPGGGRFSDFRGAQYGEITTKFRNEDGTFNYAEMERINAGSEQGAVYCMTEQRNNHNWLGLISTYTTQIGESLEFYGGIDTRYYKGIHQSVICDLMGGKYFVDATRASINPANSSRAADPEWVNQKLGVGDVMYRDYDGYVMQGGFFAQAEYNTGFLSAFVSGSLARTKYWKRDRYYYDGDRATSDKVAFAGGNIKGGANFNFSESQNVFANAGFISRAPKLAYGAFMVPNTSNVLNKDAKNEKVFSFELGYGLENGWIDLAVNAYMTKWMDKTMTQQFRLGNGETAYMNMTGVDALHKGVELELKLTPAAWVDFNAMLSVGDWRWDSDAHGLAYDDHSQAINDKGDKVAPDSPEHLWAAINLKDVKVGGSAQTTSALGLTLRPMKTLRIGSDVNFYARNYAYYSFTGNNLKAGQTVVVADPWRVPHDYQIDFNASYTFAVGPVNATVMGNVHNITDNFYISKAYNPLTTYDMGKDHAEANADNVSCFYAFGRTFTVKLKLEF